MLYCHLYCNIKCYFSSSETHWQNQLQEVLYEKGVLTNFLKETLLQVFSCDFSEICTTTFFTKLLWATASVYRTMSNIYDRTFLWKYRRSRPEVFFKKMFLQISQNSQESTCARQLFNKVVWHFILDQDEIPTKVTWQIYALFTYCIWSFEGTSYKKF